LSLAANRLEAHERAERLFWLVESVWQAIKRGDDPGVAYDAAMRSDAARAKRR
jgi:hypothetical protein